MRLLSQERSNLGVMESRMVKLARKFMRIQACGDSLLKLLVSYSHASKLIFGVVACGVRKQREGGRRQNA